MTPTTLQSPPDGSDVLATYREYLLASISLDAKRVAAYYDEPFMFVSAARTVTIATRVDAEAFLGPGFAELRQAGYAKTEFPELRTRSMGKGLAVVSGKGIRIAKDGREMSTLGLTYVWRELSDGWKMSVMVVHDPKVLPLI